MAKYSGPRMPQMPRVQQTRIMLGDVDISNSVSAVRIERDPRMADVAELTMYVTQFGEEEDGTFVIRLLGPEGLMIRPEKRIVL